MKKKVSFLLLLLCVLGLIIPINAQAITCVQCEQGMIQRTTSIYCHILDGTNKLLVSTTCYGHYDADGMSLGAYASYSICLNSPSIISWLDDNPQYIFGSTTMGSFRVGLGIDNPAKLLVIQIPSTATYSIEHYKQKADGSGYEKEAGMTGSGNATVGTGVDGHMNMKGVI